MDEERKRQLRHMRQHHPGFCALQPEYLEAVRNGQHFDTLIGYVEQGGGMKVSELTAAQAEQLEDANRQKPIGEPTLATLFPEYQNWRDVSQRVLGFEAGRFENYLKGSPLFNTAVSLLDDVQAAELLRKLEENPNVAYTPRLESRKTLSQMAQFLRERGYRRGPLLFQKLKVEKTRAEKKKSSSGKRAKKKFYHPKKEIPIIFDCTSVRIEEKSGHERELAHDAFEAAATMYLGAFRPVDVRGDSEPDVGGLRWEGVLSDDEKAADPWEGPFEITYWNSKSGRWDTKKNTHGDLKPILKARWERQGCPRSGLIFYNRTTGENFGSTHDWGLDDIIHKEAGITKKAGRKLYGFRHAAAVAAGSGVWSEDGSRWSKEDVGKLLNDTSKAVDEYFDIIDEALHELASNTPSHSWGLTPSRDSSDAPTHVTADQPLSDREPCQG